MTRLRRRWPAGFLLIVVAALAPACGGDESTTSLPTEAAPPQEAELTWSEQFPETGAGFSFRIRRFAVTADGWEADVEVENRTDIPWRLPGAEDAVPTSFGVMLFRTDDVEEVEQRSANGDLPGLAGSSTYTPSLPTRLAPARDGAEPSRHAGRSRRASTCGSSRPVRRGWRSAGGDGAAASRGSPTTPTACGVERRVDGVGRERGAQGRAARHRRESHERSSRPLRGSLRRRGTGTGVLRRSVRLEDPAMPELSYHIVSTGPATDEGMPSEPGYIGGGMAERRRASPNP